jgi:hypothetical protein
MPHFGHFTVFCGAGVADVPAASGDAADVLGGAVARGAGAGADLSTLLDALFGALTTGFAALFGTAVPGCRAIGLSEVVPLMLKFYRDAAPQAWPRRGCAPH